MNLAESETLKYQETWSIPSYHDYSHGENYADLFMEMTGAEPGESVIDLGCGTGRGGKALEERGLVPTYLDLANYNDLHPFIAQPLWEPISTDSWPVDPDYPAEHIGPRRCDYGLCCDVMEHLPPEYTMLAIRNIMDACSSVFFSICFQDEAYSEIVGEPLHLTVMPFVWWRDHLAEMGNLVEARDFSPPHPTRALKVGVFYVT